jgi:hypothetical protein
MALGRCADFCVRGGLDAFPAPGRSDFPATAVVRGDDAVVPGEIDAWFWHEGRETGDEIHRIEGHLRGAIPVRRLQGVDHFAGGTESGLP